MPAARWPAAAAAAATSRSPPTTATSPSAARSRAPATVAACNATKAATLLGELVPDRSILKRSSLEERVMDDMIAAFEMLLLGGVALTALDVLWRWGESAVLLLG